MSKKEITETNEVLDNEIEVADAAWDEETEETETETKASKFKVGMKRVGKVIAAGAAVAAVGFIGFMLGRSGSGSDEGCDETPELTYDPDGDMFQSDPVDGNETE